MSSVLDSRACVPMEDGELLEAAAVEERTRDGQWDWSYGEFGLVIVSCS